MESKKFRCPKSGCRKSFDHRMQLSRHKKQCNAVTPPTKQLSYAFEGGAYKCSSCPKQYRGRFNILYYVKTGTGRCQQQKTAI